MIDWKNPYVLGAGVVLGVIVLASRGGGAAEAAPSAGPSENFLLALSGNNLAQNKAGMEYSAKIAGIDANAGALRDQNQTNIALGFMQYAQNLATVAAGVDVQKYTINGEVKRAMINADNQQAMERIQSANRLAISWVSADVSKYGMDTELKATGLQADAAKYDSEQRTKQARLAASAQKQAAQYGMIGNLGGALIGGVTKLFGAK